MAKRGRDDSASGHEGYEVHARENNPSPPETEESAEHTSKYASVDHSLQASGMRKMRCMLPPHKPLSFDAYGDYETHYRRAHTNRCIECSKNFPTTLYLDLHIAENHDPIAAAKREAGEKTFACFVEGCEKVCSDWKKRRSHLVDKHAFPRNYDFLVVDHGIDGRRTMLRPGVDSDGHRRSSRERGRSGSSATATTESTEATSVSEEKGDRKLASPSDDRILASNGGAVDELTQSMSALNMVPRSITFGQRRGRSGFCKK